MTTENNTIIVMSPNEQKAKIADFIQAFAEGKAALERSGRILVELVDADPYVYNYIEQQCPAMNPELLRMLENIGRGKVLPSLAFDNSEPARIMRRFPLAMQAKLEAEPIPLVVRTQSGGLDVRMVKLSDMTRDQRAQAVDKDRLRTEGQQRAMLDEQTAKAAIVEVKATAKEMPWTIKGNRAVINGIEFTRKQLAGLLAQMD